MHRNVYKYDSFMYWKHKRMYVSNFEHDYDYYPPTTTSNIIFYNENNKWSVDEWKYRPAYW